VAECGASVRVGEKAGRVAGWATSMRRGTPELKGRIRVLAVAAKPETEFGSERVLVRGSATRLGRD
jgi:hypothetical protein